MEKLPEKLATNAASPASVTLPSSDVKACTKPLEREAVADCLKRLLKREDKVEAAFSFDQKEHPDQELVESIPAVCAHSLTIAKHAFINCCTVAWSEHYPLSLKPDHFWLMVTQAVAGHVNQNAEKLRGKLVAHEGKKELHLYRDGFVKGSDKNDWPGVFDEFSTQIKANTLPQAFDLMQCSFTTTTTLCRLASAVTLMDCMQSFFSYIVHTRCGFPSVTMEGTLADWQQLKQKAEALITGICLPDFAKWWLKALRPVLDMLIQCYEAAAKGQVKAKHTGFWNNMIKLGAVNGSGGYAYVSGWVNVFLPLVDVSKGALDRNPFLGTGSMGDKNDKKCWTRLDGLTSGLSSAPVIWDYLGTNYKMEFRAGFMGVSQSKTDFTMRPVLGWVVLDHGKEDQKK